MTEPLTLISSMATRALLAELLADYETQTGQPVRVESVGGVDAARRVMQGEAFDAVMLASKAIEELTAAGQLLPGSCVHVVRSGVAVAIPQGRPQPSIANESAVREAVLAARTLSFSTGPSGVHLERLFERWGIEPVIRERIVRAPPGIPVGQLVAQGQAELGFQQLSELLHVPGITVLGPLPADIQVLTTFSAGVGVQALQPERVKALLAWLVSPAATAAKVRQGMEPAD